MRNDVRDASVFTGTRREALSNKVELGGPQLVRGRSLPTALLLRNPTTLSFDPTGFGAKGFLLVVSACFFPPGDSPLGRPAPEAFTATGFRLTAAAGFFQLTGSLLGFRSEAAGLPDLPAAGDLPVLVAGDLPVPVAGDIPVLIAGFLLAEAGDGGFLPRRALAEIAPVLLISAALVGLGSLWRSAAASLLTLSALRASKLSFFMMASSILVASARSFLATRLVTLPARTAFPFVKNLRTISKLP